jgi:hypothetical protein
MFDGKKNWRHTIDFVFFIDISGSMSSEFSPIKRHLTRLDVVKDTIIFILNNLLLPKDTITIIVVDDIDQVLGIIYHASISL